jgi:Holliday junction resolvase RusA-like endonuclease
MCSRRKGEHLKFKVPGAPQGKARARTYCDRRTRRMKSITPEKTVLYENLIKTSYINAAEKSKFKGYFNKEPVKVSILAVYPIPQSKSKKMKKEMEYGTILPTKKPDADNIAKAICDALNGVAYGDDAQICKLCVSKRYQALEGCTPYTLVEVEEIKE